MTCARDQIQKFKIRFKPVSKLFFINFFFFCLPSPFLVFFLVPRAEVVDDAKLFPSDMNSERNRAMSSLSRIAPTTLSNFTPIWPAADTHFALICTLHRDVTPPSSPFSPLPSKSHALYAFRKTARTCLEEYAVFRGFHSIFTRGILSTRGKFSKSFVN